MKNIKTQLANSVQEVEDGNISALEEYGKLNTLHKFVKECMDQIKPIAETEWIIESEGKKTIDNFKGYQVTQKNGGWTWNFKLVKEWADLEAKKKAVETRCKALFEHQGCIDAETGEELDITRKPKADSFIFKTLN